MIEFAPYLKTGVDNFFSNDFRVIISALLGFPAFILVTAATTGERWSNADVVHFGLQQYCTVNSSFTCCSGFADSFESVPDWIGATYAFMILSSIAASLALAFSFVTLCVTSCGGKRKFLAPVASLITSFLIMIAIAIYGNNMYTESWSKETRASGSFVAAIISLVMYLGLGVVTLTGSCDTAVGVSQIYPPKTWTHYTNIKPLSEWLNINEDEANNVIVDITLGDEGIEIKSLVKELWIERLAGRGRDAEQRGYRKIVITKIERIENPVLMEKYMENRQKLFRHKSSITPVKKLVNSRSDVLTTSNLKSSFLQRAGVEQTINEHYLFHGCPAEIAPLVTQDGLDLRLASDGMLGRGTYSAENPTKSDHYAGTGHNDKKMFLMRVLLGDMFLTDSSFKLRRPPCKKCIEETNNKDACTDNSHRDRENWMYDAVLYDQNGKHREFIVYDQHKCYPEYLITYERIQH